MPLFHSWENRSGFILQCRRRTCHESLWSGIQKYSNEQENVCVCVCDGEECVWCFRQTLKTLAAWQKSWNIQAVCPLTCIFIRPHLMLFYPSGSPAKQFLFVHVKISIWNVNYCNAKKKCADACWFKFRFDVIVTVSAGLDVLYLMFGLLWL